MEFLGLLMPLAVLGDVAFVILYFRTKRLVRLVRERYPEIFTQLRGRERKWYDTSEEMVVFQCDVGRKFKAMLVPLSADDRDLAAALDRVTAGDRLVRRALWVGLAMTAILVLWFAISFGLSE